MRYREKTVKSYTFRFRDTDPEYNAHNRERVMKDKAIDVAAKELNDSGQEWELIECFMNRYGDVVVDVEIKGEKPKKEGYLVPAIRELLSILDGDFAGEKDWALRYLRAVDNIKLAIGEVPAIRKSGSSSLTCRACNKPVGILDYVNNNDGYCLHTKCVCG